LEVDSEVYEQNYVVFIMFRVVTESAWSLSRVLTIVDEGALDVVNSVLWFERYEAFECPVMWKLKLNSVALIRKRTIPTERPQLVGG
jgi:hypothetical protein